MTRSALLRMATALFVALCLPAPGSAHTRLIRLCVGLTAGGSAFAQIGQEQLTNVLLAKQKPEVYIVPIRLKSSSAGETLDEARQSHCEYAVLTEVSLKEFSTWSRPVRRTAVFFDAPYFQLEMGYHLYRLKDLKSVGNGSVASEGLNYIQDVMYNAADRLSRRILTDVNKAAVQTSKPQP